MNKLTEARQILEAFGLPLKQQNERSALVLLALCNIKENDKWRDAKKVSMSVVGNKSNAKYEGILRFISLHYQKQYAENSRETIRQQTLHQFVQAGIAEHNPENPLLPTNSKDNHYRVSDAALKVITSFGTRKWKEEVKKFRKNIGSLQELYIKARNNNKLPVNLSNGTKLNFSPGKHNQVQIAIIKEFTSRFASGSELMYVGDTANKTLYVEETIFRMLNIEFTSHSKLPDVILFDKKRNWLFLIEAVTSHGPISPKRIIELEKIFKNCGAGLVYVSAFPNFREFKKHTDDIAWETEVWVVEFPDHLIHFNGDRFMGPR